MHRSVLMLAVFVILTGCSRQEQKVPFKEYVTKPGRTPVVVEQYGTQKKQPMKTPIAATPLVPVAQKLTDVAVAQAAMIKPDQRCEPFVKLTLEAGMRTSLDPNGISRFADIMNSADANGCVAITK